MKHLSEFTFLFHISHCPTVVFSKIIRLSCTYIISFFTKKRMKIIYVIENSLFIVLFILKSSDEIGRVASIYILIILTINLVLSLTLKYFRNPKIIKEKSSED